MNDMMNEYRALFLEEAEEHIAAVNENLISLEKHRDERKLIDNIFRSAHTLKSSAAAVGLMKMSALAHKSEDLMQKVRNAEIPVTDGVINCLFAAFDIIRSCCQAVQENRDPEAVETDEVLKRLADTVASERTESDTGPASTSREARAVEWTLDDKSRTLLKKKARCFQADVVIDDREPLKWLRAELLLNKVTKNCVIAGIQPDKGLFLKPGFDGAFSLLLSTDLAEDVLFIELTLDLIREIRLTPMPGLGSAVEEAGQEESSSAPVETDGIAESAPAQTAPTVTTAQAEKMKESHKAKNADTIRVGVDKLDTLMNLIGELATAISGVRQIERRAREENSSTALLMDISSFEDKLTNISSDLQYNIMITRMLPVSTVFSQFNRVVRDVSREMKKKVSLILQGEETELDKRIIDSIGEPLMHLVRNAVDHGIEPPEERKAAGKREDATLILSAGRSGNHIVVSVRDDGRGMDEERIRTKAVEKGLVDKEAASQMTPEQIRQFVFLPGFSTSEKVSNMSGRGVGLDVVKNVVTGLNGSVEVWSEPGRGTEFHLVLPLTLTTTSVVLCRSGEALYAVSINDIMESLSVTPEMIRWVDGRRMISLRDEILPLVDLEEIFEGKKKTAGGEMKKVIVVFYKDKKIGISVSAIETTDEIVLKNLEKHYRNIPGISGAAILGDGRIALVLDTIGLIGILKDRLDAKPAPDREKKPVKTQRKKPAKSEAVQARQEKAPEKSPVTDSPKPPAGEVNPLIRAIFDESFQEAAGSLSQLTGKAMDFHYASAISLLSPDELINRIQDDMARPYFGSIIRSSSGLRSDVILLVDDADGAELYELLTGTKPEEGEEGREDVLMAIGEVNNILSSSFINHVANAVKKEIHPTTPSNRHDMLGALMQAAVLMEETAGKKILCADTVIAEKGRKALKSRMFVITDAGGLAHILEKE